MTSQHSSILFRTLNDFDATLSKAIQESEEDATDDVQLSLVVDGATGSLNVGGKRFPISLASGSADNTVVLSYGGKFLQRLPTLSHIGTIHHVGSEPPTTARRKAPPTRSLASSTSRAAPRATRGAMLVRPKKRAKVMTAVDHQDKTPSPTLSSSSSATTSSPHTPPSSTISSASSSTTASTTMLGGPLQLSSSPPPLPTTSTPTIARESERVSGTSPCVDTLNTFAEAWSGKPIVTLKDYSRRRTLYLDSRHAYTQLERDIARDVDAFKSLGNDVTQATEDTNKLLGKIEDHYLERVHAFDRNVALYNASYERLVGEEKCLREFERKCHKGRS